MNRFSLFTQILMIAVAVAIGFLYIQPKVKSIREAQDLTANYELETNNVSQVNANLKAKIAEIEAVNAQDVQLLSRFIPDTVDEIAVMKDLTIILNNQLITDYEVGYKGNSNGVGEIAESTEVANNLIAHKFSLSFSATYQQLKDLLGLLETNNYLLQVSDLSISEGKDKLLTVTMTLTTFARQNVVSVATEVMEVTE